VSLESAVVFPRVRIAVATLLLDLATAWIALGSFLIAGWRMIRPQSTRKAQMKTILMLIVGLMLAGCGSMENHVRNRDAVDTICACP
jgi:hypothetical protein